jgi:hypothetical protein
MYIAKAVLREINVRKMDIRSTCTQTLSHIFQELLKLSGCYGKEEKIGI